MPRKSKPPKHSTTKSAASSNVATGFMPSLPSIRKRRRGVLPSRDTARAPSTSAVIRLGGRSSISAAARRELTTLAPVTSWLPQQWSPFACVFTSVSMCSAAFVAPRIAASMSRVSRRS